MPICLRTFMQGIQSVKRWKWWSPPSLSELLNSSPIHLFKKEVHISMELKDTNGKVPQRDYTKRSSRSKSSDEKRQLWLHTCEILWYIALEGKMEKRNVKNRFTKNEKNFRESMRIYWLKLRIKTNKMIFIENVSGQETAANPIPQTGAWLVIPPYSLVWEIHSGIHI